MTRRRRAIDPRVLRHLLDAARRALGEIELVEVRPRTPDGRANPVAPGPRRGDPDPRQGDLLTATEARS